MLKILDSILLSSNVVEEFYKYYNKSDFKKWLLSILPEVENCKNLKQDNPWHIYNCLDHILHSVQNINMQTKDLDASVRKRLAYVMFLHDIGKPECYLRRYSKQYGREVDSFFNHNKASVKIADRVLALFGFDKKEQEIIKLLIEEHDIFMFIRLNDDGNKYHKVLTTELIEDHVEKYDKFGDGEQLLSQLIMVGRADSLSQNPRMTSDTLTLHDKMNEILVSKNNNVEIKQKKV